MSKKKVSKGYKKAKIIMDIVFILILIVIAMITTDYIRVSKYELKPLFAIKTQEYKDGGTKIYYGLGYKVIDYNQIQGRRDIEIGTWNLKKESKPITIEDIDLAIELNNKESSYNNYYKKFVRIITKVKEIDTKNNKLLIGYTDEDGKYSLDIVCNLVKEQRNTKFEENKEITVIGTINNYKRQTTKSNKTIYIKNCMAEQ